MVKTEKIFIKNLETGDIVAATVDNGVLSVGENFGSIGKDLPLRVSVATLDDSIHASGVITVAPEDPRYALALQEQLPDGFAVEGAQLSGKRVAWGDLIKLGVRLGNRRIGSKALA